jgi:hypothetical protein
MSPRRKAGIAAKLTSVIGVLADLGYPGWDQAVITGRRKPRGKDLTAAQRAANRVGRVLNSPEHGLISDVSGFTRLWRCGVTWPGPLA